MTTNVGVKSVDEDTHPQCPLYCNPLGRRGAGAIPLAGQQHRAVQENPVSRVITLPLRYEAQFDNGAKVTKHILEIDQALVPFRLIKDWTLITRTKLFRRSAAA